MTPDAKPIATGSAESPSLDALLVGVLDQLTDAFLLLDKDWRIVYANTMARRISRIQPDSLNRDTLWELYPELVGTNLEQAYRAVAATAAPRTVEGFYYEPFDTWFDIHILPAARGVAVHYRDVTSIHQAEIAKAAAGEKLEQVFDATTDAMAVLDRAWRFTFVNRKAKEFVRTEGEYLGANIWERFPAMAAPGSPFFEHYHRAMDQRVAGEFETFYPAPLSLWLHVVVRPLKEGIIVFFQDITARKLQEEAVRASEERYRVLTELNPQALWTADPQGLVLYANQRFLDYIGKDFVPRDGMEYLQCFYEGDRDRVFKVWSHSVATGEDYVIDARLIRAADGAVRWWHLRALPIRDEAGAIQQWLGMATDVHENRMGADRLREQYTEIERQRRELEAIYRGSPIGMSLYEPKQLRLIRLNDRQSQIWDLHPTEALGKSIMELAPGLTDSHEMIRRAAQGERIFNQEVQGVLPNRPDEWRYWNVNFSPIFAENGTVQAIAAATIETTQQKRAELALLQAEKLAAVGRLASSIAHEINNPLESIINLIYLARQYAVLPDVQRLLDAADEELRRVSILATQTLRFHKQSTRPQAISCADLFSTVLTLYAGRLKNSNIAVEIRERTTQPVVCFEGDIRQVLSNLIGNAIDAMPQGGRLILRSRLTMDWKTGHRGFALTVADTGSGMDKATMRRIFEAFFTTKGFAGTGLGLWVCAEVMERHHGRLQVRSSQHRGTVITVFLPTELPPADENRSPQ